MGRTLPIDYSGEVNMAVYNSNPPDYHPADLLFIKALSGS